MRSKDMHRSSVVVTALVTGLVGVLTPTSARAGLAGQTPPTSTVRIKIQTEAANILKGDIATGRPNLLLLVQANGATDFTDLVARVVGDDTTYGGLAETLDELIKSEKSGDRRNDLIYNLVRVHLLRSQRITHTFDRATPLAEAATAAERFPTDLEDPAAWELKGDVYAESGEPEKAIANYKRMQGDGALAAQVQYKTGWAWERVNHMDLATTCYKAAVRAMVGSESGPQLRHLVYQGLTRTALASGDNQSAVTYLAKSSSVGNDEDAPFPYRMDAANRLLQRGFARQVLAYAKAALVATPDDPDAIDLRERAAAVARR